MNMATYHPGVAWMVVIIGLLSGIALLSCLAGCHLS
jgi:hypothetical protein